MATSLQNCSTHKLELGNNGIFQLIQTILLRRGSRCHTYVRIQYDIWRLFDRDRCIVIVVTGYNTNTVTDTIRYHEHPQLLSQHEQLQLPGCVTP